MEYILYGISLLIALGHEYKAIRKIGMKEYFKMPYSWLGVALILFVPQIVVLVLILNFIITRYYLKD